MTAPAIFSLIPLTDVDDLPEPENGPYYVATQKGYMVMQRSHFGNTLTPVDEVSTLPNTPSIIWKAIPKLPAALVGQVWSFFRATLEDKNSEAMVDITWSEEKGYRIFVPPQEASHGGVKAQRNLNHYQGQLVGTIHSHCDFSAFHSGTDRHDADQHNGLHITLGMVNHDQPEVAVMISQNGEKWDPIPADEAIDGPLSLVDHPRWWENFVTKPKPAQSSVVWFGGRPTPNSVMPTTRATHKTDATIPPHSDNGWATLLAAAVHAGVADKYNEQLGDIEWELEKLAETLDILGIDLRYTFHLSTLGNASMTGVIYDDDDAYPLSTTIFGS